MTGFLTTPEPAWLVVADLALVGLAAYLWGRRDGRGVAVRGAVKKNGECQHETEIIACQHETLPDGPFGGGGKVTIVLARCYTCKGIEAKRLPGTWNLDQLTGERPATAVDSLIAASKDKL